MTDNTVKSSATTPDRYLHVFVHTDMPLPPETGLGRLVGLDVSAMVPGEPERLLWRLLVMAFRGKDGWWGQVLRVNPDVTDPPEGTFVAEATQSDFGWAGAFVDEAIANALNAPDMPTKDRADA